jgi:hypothetical protein
MFFTIISSFFTPSNQINKHIENSIVTSIGNQEKHQQIASVVKDYHIE